MKRWQVILGITLLLCCYALISCGHIFAKTLYYSPVVNFSGEKVAYVKRKLSYSAWGGSIIPFMGKQAAVKVRSDKLQLCEKKIDNGKVTILEEWNIPILKPDRVGHVIVVLNWDLENLRYSIKLSSQSYGQINIGKFRHPYWTLTNTQGPTRLKQGPSAGGGYQASVSSKPGGRYPGSNKLIVEKTWVKDFELPKIKQRLALRSEQTLNELNRTLSETEKTKDSDAKKVKAEIDKSKRLSEFIAKQKPSRLPENLIRLFIEEIGRPLKKYPDLMPYVSLLGESGVRLLLSSYERASVESRLQILSALGGIGRSSALALIRKEIKSDNALIQKEAITALGMVKKERAKEELDMILADADLSPLGKKTVLMQLKEIHAAKWHSTVLRTALSDEILFEQLPSIVPDFETFPKIEVWKQRSSIFEILQRNNPKTCQIAQQLIFTFDQGMYLKNIYPILDDLLKANFEYGKTVDASGKLLKINSMPSADVCLWNKGMASTLLQRVESTVEKYTFVSWYRNATQNFKSLLNLLYIEHMYLQKGGRIINRPPIRFAIKVVVKDSKSKIFASARHVMQLDKPETLQGKSLVSGYPSHTYEGRILLNRNTWRLKMANFIIRLKPQGVSFPVEIPFGGTYETIVEEQFNGKSKAFQWTIKHIDGQKS